MITPNQRKSQHQKQDATEFAIVRVFFPQRVEKISKLNRVCFISVGEGATLPQVAIFDAKTPGF
jgi:hypothetical protein